MKQQTMAAIRRGGLSFMKNIFSIKSTTATNMLRKAITSSAPAAFQPLVHPYDEDSSVNDNKTFRLTPQLFIEVPVPNQESVWSCIMC